MVTVIFLFRLIYISNTTQIKLLPTDLLQSKKSSQESDSELDDEFLVNTFGCKMTRLPVMTSKIREFFKPPDRIICLPPAITKSNECKN